MPRNPLTEDALDESDGTKRVIVSCLNRSLGVFQSAYTDSYFDCSVGMINIRARRSKSTR